MKPIADLAENAEIETDGGKVTVTGSIHDTQATVLLNRGPAAEGSIPLGRRVIRVRPRPR